MVEETGSVHAELDQQIAAGAAVVAAQAASHGSDKPADRE